MRRTNTLVTFALIVIAGACGGSDSPTETPSGPTVTAATSLQFSPSTLNIDVGQSVTWVFQAVEHTVTFNATAGAPANIPATHSTNVSRTFATAGTFVYICTIHSGMTGTIHVGP